MIDTLTKFMHELDALIEANKYLRLRVEELEAKPLDNKPKLSDREVRDIREAYRGGMSQVDLANNYGVNPSTVSRIVRGFYH